MPGTRDLEGPQDLAPLFVAEAISEVRAKATHRPRLPGEFRALCRELPLRIESSGLAKALVDLAGNRGASRGNINLDTASGLVLHHLRRWFCREGGPFQKREDAEYLSEDLFVIEEVIGADVEYLDYAEEDARPFLRWLKRLAEVEFGEASDAQDGAAATTDAVERTEAAEP